MANPPEVAREYSYRLTTKPPVYITYDITGIPGLESPFEYRDANLSLVGG
jgi:hypothetical protein